MNIKYSMLIGVDESGCGPLLGRVYTAAVILPPDFNTELLKDSKKFTSKKKIKEVYDYIKSNASYYAVSYKEADYIDSRNILNAKLDSMTESITNVISQIKPLNIDDLILKIDGNSFKPYSYYIHDDLHWIPYECIVKGDQLVKAISAASILAKVERDKYIEELCLEYPEYDEKYDLLKNKGYGTKKHIDGIRQHGYCKFHRMSYKLKTI